MDVVVDRIRPVLIAVGVALLGVTLVEMYVWWVVYSYVDLSFAAGLVISVPANCFLVGVGWWLPRTGIDEHRYRSLAVSTVVGTAILGTFSTITGVTFFPDIVWAQVSSIRWGLSVGAGIGLLVGVLNARTVEQVLDAERASIRAEEAGHQREFLEYMNALLRHEVLNTANVIEGYAELLTDEVDAESEDEVAEFTEVIRRQTGELTTVIEDARLLTAIADDATTFEAVDLRGVLETELRNARDRQTPAGATNVEFRMNAPDEVYVWGDHLLRRVFSNLLANAVVHNDSDPIRVSIDVSTSPDRVTVDVRDNGPGVPAEAHGGLFDLTVRRDSNHGLGLTIVARLVERYGGDVEVAATGPEGTTISVSLPRASGPPEAEPSSPTEPREDVVHAP